MKKLVSVILCVVFVFSLATTSFATAASQSNYSSVAAATRQAIIIIPGIMGSDLKDSSGNQVWLKLPFQAFYLDTLRMTESGTSANTILPLKNNEHGTYAMYKLLYEKLQNTFGNTYTVTFFAYDWRLDCASNAKKLQDYINTNFDKVVLVAHSMGGLVASSYLARDSANRSKVSKLITIATPYTGTPDALYKFETGDVGAPLNVLLPLKSQVKEFVKNVTSVYQLLPTSRYFGTSSYAYPGYLEIVPGGLVTNKDSANLWLSSRSWATTTSGQTKSMLSGATTFHNSLIVGSSHIANNFSSVNTYKIIGVGKDTASTVRCDPKGNYIETLLANSGDGTVPVYSASNGQETLSRSHNYTFSGAGVTHTDILKHDPALNQIISIINGSVTRTANDEMPLALNSKGWIEGMDNKRIGIKVYHAETVRIMDSNGSEIQRDGNDLYAVDGNGNRSYVGCITLLGEENSYKYFMLDGTYDFSFAGGSDVQMTVEYVDSGYYQKVLTYEDLDYANLSVQVSNYNTKEVSCGENAQETQNFTSDTPVIQPTHEMTPDELMAINQ